VGPDRGTADGHQDQAHDGPTDQCPQRTGGAGTVEERGRAEQGGPGAGRQPLSEADERMLFGWLVEQTGTPVTAQLTAKFQRLRTRRQDRLAAGGPE